MAVFRVVKNNNYTVMSNYHLQDVDLSLKAKGMLSYMLSLPADWDYSINGLVAQCKENVKAIRSVLNELIENNYIKRDRVQEANGQFSYDYQIFELPYTQKGHAVEGHAVKAIQQSTKELSTNNKDMIDIEDMIFKMRELQIISNEEEEDRVIADLRKLKEQYGLSSLKKVLNKLLVILEDKIIREEIFDIKHYFKSSLESNIKKKKKKTKIDHEIKSKPMVPDWYGKEIMEINTSNELEGIFNDYINKEEII